MDKYKVTYLIMKHLVVDFCSWLQVAGFKFQV